MKKEKIVKVNSKYREKLHRRSKLAAEIGSEGFFINMQGKKIAKPLPVLIAM